MPLTLVVLAAGIGSRYGGLKQVDGVGPSGEYLMDYAVYDAVRAGFSNLVFVTRPDVEDVLRTRFEGLSGVTRVETVNQRLSDVPPGFGVPVGREKPWGTAHALLVTERVVQSPFAAINADDFYGAEAFRLLKAHFERPAPRTGGPVETALVAYPLRDTLSPLGNVARGICEADAEGYITRVTEVKQIDTRGGVIRGVDEDDRPWILSGDEPTSMNFWGFTPDVFPLVRREFEAFLSRRSGDLKAECYISNTLGTLAEAGRVRLRMYRTATRWFGMTNRGDRDSVVGAIRQLVTDGVYPPDLFGR